MRKFVPALFAVTLIFGYALIGPDPMRIARALGVALTLTAIGWVVARKADWRISAASVATLMSLAWIGH